MYEELIRVLRHCGNPNVSCKGCSDEEDCIGSDGAWEIGAMANMRAAAEAIEELSLVAESNERSAARWAETASKAFEQIPRWIPVTERLPEKNQIVVAHAGKGAWDFGMFRGISPSGNQEYWHWKKNTLKYVKWWMPKDGAIPEPPKEENFCADCAWYEAKEMYCFRQGNHSYDNGDCELWEPMTEPPKEEA